MKKIFSLFVLCSFQVFSQTTIFSETFGSPSGTTAITAYEAANGFDNDSSTMTNGGAANPADVRSTSASSGYTGASGAGNIYFTTADGSIVPKDERGFAIEGINAASYTGLKLNFAVRKENGAGTAFASLAIQFWDGTAYQTLAVTGFPTSSSASNWFYVSGAALPPAAQINGLKIRFVKSGLIACRLDDISIVSDSSVGDDDTTTVPQTDISTSALSLGFGQINSVPSASQNFTVSGINLTDNIVVTPPANFEVSLNNSLWNTTALTLPQSGGTVNMTIIYVRYNPSGVGSHSGNIVFTSTGVPSQIVSVNGTYTTVVPPSSDYYSSAYRLYGTALRTALHDIIKGHTSVSYDALWTHFQTTDKKTNGKVWDMYSDIPGATPPYEYTFSTNQCGNYSGENGCYNREHSWPKSWFNDLSPSYTDLFHLFPTDGYVNGKRSNYNYGNVAVPTWTSQNGSKLGSNTFPGFSGTVFEPINAYKGDLARGHMYMSVRYYTEDGGWSTSDGTNKSDLLPWYANLLYSWHILDSVSTKEINRNNAVFGIQKNRNPFIDHPEFAAEIWQTSMAPSVVSVLPNQTTIVIDFSRYLDSVAAVTKVNYSLDQSIGNPQSIQWGLNNDISKVTLTVPTLLSGTTYSLTIHNLKSINNVAMSDTTITFKTSGVSSVEQSSVQPISFVLMQNYPNPFNPSTIISYQISATSDIKLKVFDVLGREIAILVNGRKEAGSYTVSFDAKNLSGGMFFYQLQSGNFIGTKKMVFAK